MLLKKLSLCLTLALALSGCTSNSNVKETTDKASHDKPTVSTSSSSSSGSTVIEPSQDTPKIEPAAAVATSTPAKVAPVVLDKPFTPVEVSNHLGLQTKKIEWSWMYSPKENATLLSKYHGYAFGDTTSKVIYLTFDEGYENGYTGSILDTLKANDVKAAFFVTKPYVTGTFNGVKDIDLMKRMFNEGHLICNHSVHHQSMPSFTDENTFNTELTGVQSTVDGIPGLKMSKFFRPPMGEFSELSLYYTQKLGYKSIFFALAHDDWDPAKQPDPVTAKKNLLKETKPGMICLLHALSKTNASILDDLIKEWKSEGYQFKTLNELP